MTPDPVGVTAIVDQFKELRRGFTVMQMISVPPTKHALINPFHRVSGTVLSCINPLAGQFGDVQSDALVEDAM